jgi:aurora kinase, other
VVRKIGEGSYSEVYLAVERRSGFVCALKVLEKWKMRELGVEENVIREIKLNMFLCHPNIAKLYGCFHDQHHIYLVCEYATNNNLY